MDRESGLSLYTRTVTLHMYNTLHCPRAELVITIILIINSTNGADASVLAQMNIESAQTICMHCYKFQNTYIVTALALTIS